MKVGSQCDTRSCVVLHMWETFQIHSMRIGLCTVHVIKKFTRPALFTGNRSKSTGLERNDNGMAVPFHSVLLHLRAKF